MKKTESWAVRYFKPYRHSTSRRPYPIDSTTVNIAKGIKRTLKADGTIVDRPLIDGEQAMQINLLGEYIIRERSGDGQLVDNHYPQQIFEIPKDGFAKKDFASEEWDILKKNKDIITFLQEHTQMSWKDTKGKQLNPNFPVGCDIYYTMHNLDGIEAEKAAQEIREHELTGVLIAIKQDHDELTNLAYGLAINPTGLSDSDIFNIIKDIIRTSPDKFEKFLKDGNNWFIIVINKALRTERGPAEENYLVDDGYRNYKMNGIMIAHNFDSLIGYFKDNEDIFEGLQNSLGMKKKMNLKDSKQSDQKSSNKSERVAKEVAEVTK